MATANKNLSEYNKADLIDAKDLKIGLVVSEWNDKITNGLFQDAYDVLIDCGTQPENIVRWDVLESFELIFGRKKMHQSENFDAVIAKGCVIQGETKH